MPQGEQRQTPPDDLEITYTPREPETRSDVGVEVHVDAKGSPRHRLVTVGDSLTHGFQSGAIYNTDLSYPAIIAWELGWYEHFRHPHYPGFGGVPFNIEFHLRELEASFGDTLSWWELPGALLQLHQRLAEAESWWDDGPGSALPSSGPINHNLGIYGWDLRDALSRTAGSAHDGQKTPNGHHIVPLVRNADRISAGRVLGSARKDGGVPMSPLEAAAALSREGTVEDRDGDGIETLIVALGANNALGSVLSLSVHWSEDADYADLLQKSKYNVWRPKHFSAEWALVVERVREIKARHVIFATVPHVTIAPVARGVGDKIKDGSRYFSYYTRPWISEDDFDPADDPHLTGDEARQIDSAIDSYNETIVSSVKAAREEGRDWRVLDLAGILDRVASRRYIDDPAARPPWWTRYELPAGLDVLKPVPDSRFFASGPEGRIAGGLFALDGVHPTTIAYGVMAQEFIRVMQEAGVVFMRRDGLTPRSGDVTVDWDRLIKGDSLISHPPASLRSDIKLIGWFDQRIDIVKRLWVGAA